eukprot:1191954-Prorocentrum_minimum.AAC.6
MVCTRRRGRGRQHVAGAGGGGGAGVGGVCAAYGAALLCSRQLCGGAAAGGVRGRAHAGTPLRTDPSGCASETIRLSDYQTFRLSDYHTIRLSDYLSY